MNTKLTTPIAPETPIICPVLPRLTPRPRPHSADLCGTSYIPLPDTAELPSSLSPNTQCIYALIQSAIHEDGVKHSTAQNRHPSVSIPFRPNPHAHELATTAVTPLLRHTCIIGHYIHFHMCIYLYQPHHPPIRHNTPHHLPAVSEARFTPRWFTAWDTISRY
ncbi:hypothetical protein P153DRAFT_383402 [Dothidotthia symphoricarpi CBS 119687]|uniref:Uncharacterized protein n=1 Tax=Dothidotthia symphoricarpi CBS 119687 TaxID=1392245 RepID=A0A6A6AH67_9PLEO|nr:uncharacterized protein P153DRAFT_383402 [Dothidotthia symphoricarpi CBS 119687]KAF2131289.1 hypothetical protein P153DRAFT_383402 [Dothidotthia symphoricarpi CBS 119687]